MYLAEGKEKMNFILFNDSSGQRMMTERIEVAQFLTREPSQRYDGTARANKHWKSPMVVDVFPCSYTDIDMSVRKFSSSLCFTQFDTGNEARSVDMEKDSKNSIPQRTPENTCRPRFLVEAQVKVQEHGIVREPNSGRHDCEAEPLPLHCPNHDASSTPMNGELAPPDRNPL